MIYKELTDIRYLAELVNFDIIELVRIGSMENGGDQFYYGDNGMYYDIWGLVQMYSIDLISNKPDGHRLMDVKRIFSEEEWYDYQLSLMGKICSV